MRASPAVVLGRPWLRPHRPCRHLRPWLPADGRGSPLRHAPAPAQDAALPARCPVVPQVISARIGPLLVSPCYYLALACARISSLQPVSPAVSPAASAVSPPSFSILRSSAQRPRPAYSHDLFYNKLLKGRKSRVSATVSPHPSQNTAAVKKLRAGLLVMHEWSTCDAQRLRVLGCPSAGHRQRASFLWSPIVDRPALYTGTHLLVRTGCRSVVLQSILLTPEG